MRGEWGPSGEGLDKHMFFGNFILLYYSLSLLLSWSTTTLFRVFYLFFRKISLQSIGAHT